MNTAVAILLPAVAPALAGFLLLTFREPKKQGIVTVYTAQALVLTVILLAVCLFAADGEVTVGYLMRQVPVSFRADGLGKTFALVVVVIWMLTDIISYFRD